LIKNNIHINYYPLLFIMGNTLFNWKQYICNYPDLTKSGITTEVKAKNHWFRHGRHEGRTYNEIFIDSGSRAILTDSSSRDILPVEITEVVPEVVPEVPELKCQCPCGEGCQCTGICMCADVSELVPVEPELVSAESELVPVEPELVPELVPVESEEPGECEPVSNRVFEETDVNTDFVPGEEVEVESDIEVESDCDSDSGLISREITIN